MGPTPLPPDEFDRGPDSSGSLPQDEITPVEVPSVAEPPPPPWYSNLWGWVKKAAVWARLNLLGPVAALVVVSVAIILVAMGYKELQIGGLLGRLLGRKDEPDHKAVDVANSVTPERVDNQGQLIPVGKPDDKGFTQVHVVPIEEPGLFSDPSVVTVLPPGKTAPITVQLPTGVTATQVDQVVVVKPDTYVVTVKDNSGIDAKTVDDLLSKYDG